MEKENFIKVLQEKKLTRYLDSIVHDAASQMASAANNDGVEGQLDFLIDTCGWTEEDILNGVTNWGDR
jgi:hypothetical protein